MPRTPAKSRLAKSGEPAFGCTSGSSVRGAAWVCVAGELNLVTAPRLERAVRQATGRARLVVVDLRGLTRVDAAGVGALVSTTRSARRDGRRLFLVRGLPQVDRLLTLTGASNSVETIDLATGEPTVLALLHIARRDRASGRARARPPRHAVERPGELPLLA
jgi:anti-anti-sigma factor